MSLKKPNGQDIIDALNARIANEQARGRSTAQLQDLLNDISKHTHGICDLAVSTAFLREDTSAIQYYTGQKAKEPKA